MLKASDDRDAHPFAGSDSEAGDVDGVTGDNRVAFREMRTTCASTMSFVLARWRR